MTTVVHSAVRWMDTQGYKWVPARIEVDIVYEKVYSYNILHRELRKLKGIILAQ